MSFTPMSQNQLKSLSLQEGQRCTIEYLNKDYFNGEETKERGEATVTIGEDGSIYFNVVDPYGMEKLIMQARIIKV